MAKKKKGAADAGAGADAPAKSGKAKSALLGAGLLLAGAMGQRFVLSSAPAQVIIAPPIDGGVATGERHAESALDCSAVGPSTEAAAEAPHAKRSAEAAVGGTADLNSMTINLADGHYLKVGLTLELGDTVVAEEFSTRTAKASDVALNYFSTKTMDQLTSDKHAGIKVELTCLLQGAYVVPDEEGSKAEPEPVVTGVLFREFLTS